MCVCVHIYISIHHHINFKEGKFMVNMIAFLNPFMNIIWLSYIHTKSSVKK